MADYTELIARLPIEDIAREREQAGLPDGRLAEVLKGIVMS